MRIERFLLVAAVASTLSCSDFLDSKSKPEAPTEKPQGKTGTNPFDPDFDPNAGDFSESKMLANIGLNVIEPQTRAFRLQTEMLETEVKELCVALQTSDAKDQEKAVQSRWAKATLIYHRLESAPVGPLSDSARFLSDGIYGWPAFNPCGIDNEVLKLKSTGIPNKQLLYTLKGLAGLEYLFFETELKTQCNPKNARNKEVVEWTTRPLREKRQDRCRFGSQLAEDLAARATQLEKAWDPQGDNFSKVMVDGSRFASVHEAVNAVSDSLFSLEEVKDLRLGQPLGLHKACTSPERKCPDAVEHPWSGLGLKSIIARLEGFKAVFLGSETPIEKRFGFDDNLKSIGRSDVSAHIVEAVDQALASARLADQAGALQDQVAKMNVANCQSTDATIRPLICTLYHDVRQATVKLKTEFLTALSLKVPPTHQGDND